MDGARVSALAFYRLQQERASIIQKEKSRRLQKPEKGQLLSLSKTIQKKPKGKKKVSLTKGCSQVGLEPPEPKKDNGWKLEGEPEAVAPQSGSPAADAEKRGGGLGKHRAQHEPAEPARVLPPTARQAEERAAEPERALPETPASAAGDEDREAAGAEKVSGRPRSQRAKGKKASLAVTAGGRDREQEQEQSPGAAEKPKEEESGKKHAVRAPPPSARAEEDKGALGKPHEGPRKRKGKKHAAEPASATPPTAKVAKQEKRQSPAASPTKPTASPPLALENPSRAPRRRKAQRGEGEAELERAAAEPVEGQSDPGAGSGTPSLQRVLQELGQIPHSKRRAARLFEWLIAPLPADRFFSHTWEKDVVLVRRGKPDYYRGLFSTAELDSVLRGEDVQFGQHLDAARYRDGRRETLNPPGRALPATAWSLYREGCSLRLLCPQAFSAAVWQVLSVLQEHFGSMVGANAYLTPPGAQGFAPHYDDIEAFVLQLEGKKRWRVYQPREQAEELPQYSSPNFGPQGLGEPVLHEVLEPGDLLYFPRGFIHQAECEPGVHSLHLTLSTYQRNSWGHLLEPLLPAALQAAMEEDVEFRRGLPRDYLDYMGVQHSESGDPRRSPFLEKVQALLARLAQYAPVDAVADQRAKGFLHDCLPPVLSEKERARSVHGLPARWEAGEARDVGAEVTPETQVRLLRHGLTRLVSEDDSVLLYYTVENSRVYHQGEPKYLEIDPQYTDGIEYLFSSYPGFVQVGDLPCENREDQISLVTMLFEKGLLITKKPVTPQE